VTHEENETSAYTTSVRAVELQRRLAEWLYQILPQIY
jgi:hypothetical protein